MATTLTAGVCEIGAQAVYRGGEWAHGRINGNEGSPAHYPLPVNGAGEFKKNRRGTETRETYRGRDARVPSGYGNDETTKIAGGDACAPGRES